MSILLEVIEWPDTQPNEMISRYPAQGSADIKLGAQLIVRESQSAVFYRDGKACDSFGPGRHTLTTFNLPIITKLFSAPWAFESIFKAEVYFINHKSFVNLKWGTREPVAFRDKELGLIRLRAFGAYSCKINEPILFINQLVGREAKYTTPQIEDYLREIIVSRVNDILGESIDSFLDLPSKYEAFGSRLSSRLQSEFGKFGIELNGFYINSITPPDDVQKMIDERGGMAAVKDMDQFLKFQLAKTLETGGAVKDGAGVGAAIGVGMGVGMLMPGFMSKAFMPDQQDLKTAGVKTVQCPECLSYTPENSRFCYKCGHQMNPMNSCPRCGKVIPVHAKFCMECGFDLHSKTVCPQCKTELPPGTHFCTNCGEKTG